MEEKQRKKISDALIGRYVGLPFGEKRKDGGYIICLYCKKEFYINKKRLNSAKFCCFNCYTSYKNNVHNPLKGFKHSKKSKLNIKIGHNNALKNEQYHINLKKSFKIRKKKYGNSKGVKDYDSLIKKIRINTIKQHLEGKFPQINTKIERIMEKELTKQKIEYIHPFPLANRWVCDFGFPNSKLIVECDGDYWHRREDVKKKDKAKDAYINKVGWKILRFWEKDIKNNINDCVDIIKEELWKSS